MNSRPELRQTLEDLQSLTAEKKGGGAADDEIIEVGPLYINKSTREVRTYDKEAKLTPIETTYSAFLQVIREGYSLLMIYLQGYGMRRHLKATTQLWFTSERLREKIEMDARNAKIIKTVWGVGYKIEK